MDNRSTRGVVTFHVKDVPIEGFPAEGIRGEIPLIRPKLYRDLESVNSEGAMKLKAEVTTWLKGHLLQDGDDPAYLENVGITAVDCVIHGNPASPVDSDLMNITAHGGCLIQILDDLADTMKFSSETGGSLEKLLDIATKFLKSESKDDNDDDEIPSEDANADLDMVLELMNEQPMFTSFLGPCMEIYQRMKSFWGEDFMTEFQRRVGKKVLQWAKTFAWGKTDNLANYSESTVRSHRLLDIGILPGREATCMFLDVCVPKEVQKHPMVEQLAKLADSIVMILNDVLGFKKDVITKESGGMVMHKILHRGLTPQQAIDEEINMAKEYVEDYLQLKQLVIDRFSPNCPDLERFVDMLELLGYCQVQSVIISPRYCMTEDYVQFKEV